MIELVLHLRFFFTFHVPLTCHRVLQAEYRCLRPNTNGVTIWKTLRHQYEGHTVQCKGTVLLAWAPKLSMPTDKTGHCGLVRGPRVDKQQVVHVTA